MYVQNLLTLTGIWSRLTQIGTPVSNYSGVLELTRDNTSWGSICGDEYRPSKSELQRECQRLGFHNIHPYVPYYYTPNPPSPLNWSSLEGDVLNTACDSNQALVIVCNPGKHIICTIKTHGA